MEDECEEEAAIAGANDKLKGNNNWMRIFNQATTLNFRGNTYVAGKFRPEGVPHEFLPKM
ncbi:hypothetical protein [Serratia fonticola]|uniref:hypothetical protein n=1 Tax=Serratia fonticola TaxID=47917 RepID=UPI001ED90D58|nr:hypothetical protein [Serratia fonticola]